MSNYTVMRPDINTDAIAARYVAGETTVQIARALGTNPTTIRARLQKAGVTLRPKGTKTLGSPLNYATYHKRVRNVRGAPSLCEDCGTSDLQTRYEWASISGNYADTNDYKRLCKTCHMAFDNVGPRVGATKLGKPRLDVAKLSIADVRILISRHATGESCSALAREYGVHWATVRSAILGKRVGL